MSTSSCRRTATEKGTASASAQRQERRGVCSAGSQHCCPAYAAEAGECLAHTWLLLHSSGTPVNIPGLQGCGKAQRCPWDPGGYQ